MPVRKSIAWRECATRLASTLPRARLHPAVLGWAEQCPAREPWVVALSGGADSVTLLLLLWAHWPERRARLRAVHFNHRLRGAAAERDERFCVKLCAALRVPLTVSRWERAPAHPSEAESRAARHAFFGKVMGKLRAHTLWLGHQQDDVAESLLMRLARGSGAGGLAAPRPVQRMPGDRVHLRLLLTLQKAELAAVLRASGATWCEDRTNAGSAYLRSRIRREVVPVWQRAVGERDAVAGAALSRELIEEDDTALESWVDRIAPLRPDGSLSLRRLRDLPVAVVRRALHRWLLRHQLSGNISRQCFATLLAAVGQQRVSRHSLGRDVFAEFGRTRLRLVSAGQKNRT